MPLHSVLKIASCCLITEIIEYVAHPDEFLRKAASLAKPGGYIVMTTPNGGDFLNRLPKFPSVPIRNRLKRSNLDQTVMGIYSCCTKMRSVDWPQKPGWK